MTSPERLHHEDESIVPKEDRSKRIWYCRIGDQEIGPISSSQLKRLASAKSLSPSDHVKKTANGDWKQADSLKSLFSSKIVSDGQFSFQCTYCGKNLRLKTRQKKESIKCPKCSSMTEIPYEARLKKVDEHCWFCEKVPPNAPNPASACITAIKRNYDDCEDEDDDEVRKIIGVPRCKQCNKIHTWPKVFSILFSIFAMFMLCMLILMLFSKDGGPSWGLGKKIAALGMSFAGVITAISKSHDYFKSVLVKFSSKTSQTKDASSGIGDYIKRTGLWKKGWKNT